jgi:hypothetical protein
MTSMSEYSNMLDKYVDQYVCIVNYHLVMIVACCLSNFSQNMDEVLLKFYQNFIKKYF